MRDIVKNHLADTLKDMCETRQIESVTVSELTERAGVSRRTFYNHFADMNDLINYTATLPLLNGMRPFATVENYYALLTEMEHRRGFYTQLPGLSAPYNFRAAYTEWTRRNFREFFVEKGLPETERVYRESLVDIFVIGATDFMFEWIESGMPIPKDEVMRIVFDAAPDFVRVRVAHTPTSLPDYPK